jgi:uncharacterized membrane protein YkvI
MPSYLRPALSLGVMVTAIFVASSVGIIDLIGQGYRYSSYFFLLVFFIPLMIRGLPLILGPSRSAGADSP